MNWTTVVDADHYDLWINNAQGMTILREQNFQGTQFIPQNPFVTGLYRAWVRAVSATGKTGAWSPVRVFTIL